MGENIQFDEEEVKKINAKYTKMAEEILEDEEKMEKMFQKLEKKLKVVPHVGNSLSYVPVMMSLVRSYVKKEYTEIPVASIIAITVALIYFVSPIDLIPDVIPGVGYFDDAIVVAGALALIKTDLEEYKKWRKDTGVEFEDLADFDDIVQEARVNNKFLDMFFAGKKHAENKN